MDYKKEIAKQKLGFTMLNACCVSTDLGMHGCMGKLVSKDVFLHIFKERLKDCFYQRWWTHISNKERFDIYHCFKTTLQCERYLGCMQSRIYKTALARFRFGVSRIHYHRLRFSAAFDLRNCPFCTTSTEDECHMLFQCPAYTDLRTNFSFETTARSGSHRSNMYKSFVQPMWTHS